MSSFSATSIFFLLFEFFFFVWMELDVNATEYGVMYVVILI